MVGLAETERRAEHDTRSDTAQDRVDTGFDIVEKRG
jgi:hypothetical protein